MDPFQVLGISSDAGEDEIKKAYRSLAKRYHPDNKETGNEAKFKEIQQAYEYALDIRKNGGRNYYQQQRQNSSYNNYNNYSSQTTYDDFFRAYGFNFEDLFRGTDSFYQNNGGNEQNLYNSAAAYINNGQYEQALNILNSIQEHGPTWFYYSAIAEAGLGNNVTARQYAKAALDMDPNNYNYRNLYDQLNRGRTNYRANTNNYSRVYAPSGTAFCTRILIFNLILNCLCGSPFGFCCF